MHLGLEHSTTALSVLVEEVLGLAADGRQTGEVKR